MSGHSGTAVLARVDCRLAQWRVREEVGRAFYPLSGPEVAPGAAWQVDVAVLDAGTGEGSDKEGVAQ
jgi:hypothetical protein